MANTSPLRQGKLVLQDHLHMERMTRSNPRLSPTDIHLLLPRQISALLDSNAHYLHLNYMLLSC
jgi:hypothetical protein